MDWSPMKKFKRIASRVFYTLQDYLKCGAKIEGFRKRQFP